MPITALIARSVFIRAYQEATFESAVFILKFDYKLDKSPCQKLGYMNFNADFFISYRILALQPSFLLIFYYALLYHQ